jgi:Neuraminidase (sialidase)
VDGLKNAICMAVSGDGGKTWGEARPIVGQGGGCWKHPGSEGNVYRSPWPMLLQDGRILVVFGRRRMPMGLGGVVSSDGGQTWSEEFVIRDDATCADLGYPVGCQLDDGRIFLAYYYTRPDGNNFGGTRHIAGSTFRIR